MDRSMISNIMKRAASLEDILKSVIPCKKLRRSTRLEIREQTETKERTIQDKPLGYFEILPLELKFQVFTYLPIEDLSLLTITSKAMRNVVELYKNTTWSQQYLLPHSINHQFVPASEHAFYCKQFQRLALLMKRSTCLYSTKDRLKLIQQFLQKYLCNYHKSCQTPHRCVALLCYGRYLHTIIAGWDDKECTKVFETIGNNTFMLKHLQSIVKVKPGTYSGLEMDVRLFFRRVFLNPCPQASDRAFWLSLILKPFPMVHQARIIFLLFGPMCGDEIQWYEMCESTPMTKDQALLCFTDLANAFRVLHHHSRQWTEDDVISVIEELTDSPEEWLAENVAHLLYLCGDSITVKVLNSKAINGRISELAAIISALCLVCVRHDHSISWVIEVVTGVCSTMENTRDKIHLLHGIVDTFKEIALDLHEYGDAEDDSGNELELMLDAQARFTKEIILMAFKTSMQA